MTFEINMVGGGWIQVRLDASDLDEVADQLRRERGLIGRLISINGDDTVGRRALIPAQRIALITEEM